MVSKASDDLPEPLNPVITVKVLRGIATSIFFRLCCRAPCTVICLSKTSPIGWVRFYCPRNRESHTRLPPIRYTSHNPGSPRRCPDLQEARVSFEASVRYAG